MLKGKYSTNQNRVLKKIFGYKAEKVTGGSRKLHVENLHNKDYSSNQGG
jgi:hypothetical protein